MARTGDLVTLHVDGVRYLEKAPLPYWLVAISFRIFGCNAFAAHLPQAIAVALLVLLGHRWGNHAFGARTGFYTAVALLTSAGVFLFTRILIPEVLLSLFLSAALYTFLKTLTPEPAYPDQPEVAIQANTPDTPERPALTWYAGPHVYPYLMWSALALAVLTKGLVALVFFFATIIGYLVLTDTWRDWRRLKPASGALLFLLIAAPWHILAGLRNVGGANGHGFFWFYLWNEHVLRFLGRRIPHDYNKLPGYLFWLQHLVWLFPWSLFFPLGLAAIWRRVQHQTSVITAHIPRDYSWAGAALVVGFGFSLSGLYILLHFDLAEFAVLAIFLNILFQLVTRRIRAHIAPSPFHRIDPQQRSILLLGIFANHRPHLLLALHQPGVLHPPGLSPHPAPHRPQPSPVPSRPSPPAPEAAAGSPSLTSPWSLSEHSSRSHSAMVFGLRAASPIIRTSAASSRIGPSETTLSPPLTSSISPPRPLQRCASPRSSPPWPLLPVPWPPGGSVHSAAISPPRPPSPLRLVSS